MNTEIDNMVNEIWLLVQPYIKYGIIALIIIGIIALIVIGIIAIKTIIKSKKK